MRGSAVASLAALLLPLSACEMGIKHTSDSSLERVFARNQVTLVRLVADLQFDKDLDMVSDTEVRFGETSFDSSPSGLIALAQRGFTADRWAYYRRLLGELGIQRALRGEGNAVALPVDEASFLSGGIYKGYWYSTSPPKGHLKASLDGYRVSEDDRDPSSRRYLLYKPIKPNWYLYLHID